MGNASLTCTSLRLLASIIQVAHSILYKWYFSGLRVEPCCTYLLPRSTSILGIAIRLTKLNPSKDY